MLPFTADQFLDVLARYNAAVWPAEIVAYLLGLAAVLVLFRPGPTADRTIAAALVAMWAFTGIGYHALFFTGINPAAWGFAALFVVEAAAIVHAGFVYDSLRFGFRTDLPGLVGLAFVAYTAVAYPLIGMAVGHGWPVLPMFGVTPCPVTIFTFGMFLLATGRVSPWLLAIPFVWSLIGGSAAFLLDVPQDWLLLASGFIAVPLIVVRNRKAG